MVWHERGKLKGSGVHLEEDQPMEVEARRAILLPVFKKALATPEYKKRTFLNGDRLTIQGVHYTVDNMKDLPEALDPRMIATRTQGDTTIFFGQNSPLSNHHSSPMVVENVGYACNEQFYFARRSQVLGDDIAHSRVMRADNPKEMLREGRKARNLANLTDGDIEVAEKYIMTHGIREKFKQNPDLKDFLCNIKSSRIGESSPSNKRWGTGFYLAHKNAFKTDLWAENKLGEIILAQRNAYLN
jgi:hypothetical protein